MLELGVTGGAAAFSSPPTRLVEGIENLQLDYGLDSDNDGAPDSYTTAPTATDWANVMAIRVNLLARNNTTTPGYSDTNTYSLGLTSVTVPTQNQAYKRHAFSELVRLINPSGRREQ
jgi:type IV pilus assembly protein PilW